MGATSGPMAGTKLPAGATGITPDGDTLRVCCYSGASFHSMVASWAQAVQSSMDDFGVQRSREMLSRCRVSLVKYIMFISFASLLARTTDFGALAGHHPAMCDASVPC